LKFTLENTNKDDKDESDYNPSIIKVQLSEKEKMDKLNSIFKTSRRIKSDVDEIKQGSLQFANDDNVNATSNNLNDQTCEQRNYKGDRIDGRIEEQENEEYDSKNITVTNKFTNINSNYNYYNNKNTNQDGIKSIDLASTPHNVNTPNMNVNEIVNALQ